MPLPRPDGGASRAETSLLSARSNRPGARARAMERERERASQLERFGEGKGPRIWSTREAGRKQTKQGWVDSVGAHYRCHRNSKTGGCSLAAASLGFHPGSGATNPHRGDPLPRHLPPLSGSRAAAASCSAPVSVRLGSMQRAITCPIHFPHSNLRSQGTATYSALLDTVF
jgi:hypothetical protein